MSESKNESNAAYNSMTVSELKEELAKRNLPKSGNKLALVERLTSYDVSMQSNPYETMVKNRDARYYMLIKPYVDNMPDLFYMELKSSPAKKQRSSVVWDNESKWKAILNDLETLDTSATRGLSGEFDVRFIEMVQNYEETMTKKLGAPSRDAFLVGLQEIDHSSSEVTRFIETYPYLSYLMLWDITCCKPVSSCGWKKPSSTSWLKTSY